MSFPFVERRRVIHTGLLSRPLDFYTGFLVTFMGLYGFIDPDWPERLPTLDYWFITIEDVYLVTAGIGVMLALILIQIRKAVGYAILLEMFSWMFISAAAAVISLTAVWIPPVAVPLPNDGVTVAWVFLWAGLAASAGLKFFMIRRTLRRAYGV